MYLLFIKFNQQYSFTFARNKKHSQYVFKSSYNTMQATHLLQHNNPPQNKPPACFNTTTHHKSNHNIHSHLQEMKNTLNMYLLFIKFNQQYSFTFARNKKQSQYVFKSPYNTMQATHLLQHNNQPQKNFQHHKYI